FACFDVLVKQFFSSQAASRQAVSPATVIAKHRRLLENNRRLHLSFSPHKEDTMSDKLLVTLSDGIKRITFNRPDRRNSIDTETIGLLREEIERSARDSSKVIILTGAGDAFCAGADLQATNARDISKIDVTGSLREQTNPTILAMRALPKPI